MNFFTEPTRIVFYARAGTKECDDFIDLLEPIANSLGIKLAMWSGNNDIPYVEAHFGSPITKTKEDMLFSALAEFTTGFKRNGKVR